MKDVWSIAALVAVLGYATSAALLANGGPPHLNAAIVASWLTFGIAMLLANPFENYPQSALASFSGLFAIVVGHSAFMEVMGPRGPMSITVAIWQESVRPLLQSEQGVLMCKVYCPPSMSAQLVADISALATVILAYTYSAGFLRWLLSPSRY